jgi:hypothetical protein
MLRQLLAICLFPAAVFAVDPYKLTVTPTSAKPADGTVKIMLALDPDQCSGLSGPFENVTFQVTGSGVTLGKSTTAGSCSVSYDLTMANTVHPGPYELMAIRTDPQTKATTLLGSVVFNVLNPLQGPIPDGLPAQVDVMWDVMTYETCADDFGKRVAGRFYCVEVVVGNNTGFPLQIAAIGFQPAGSSQDEAIQNTEPSAGYLTTRSVLQHAQALSGRSFALNAIQTGGLLMASFIPFFHNAGPKSNFTAASAIVGTTLLAGVSTLFPDLLTRELNDLDDQVLRDGKIIPNNTQVRTVVFFDRGALQSYLAPLLGNCRGLSNVRPEAIHPTANARERAVPACTQGPGVLRSRMFTGKSYRISNNVDPAMVRMALKHLVLIGDKVQYLNRIRVDSSAPSGEVSPPPQAVAAAVFPAQLVPGANSVDIAIGGEHLSGATVSTPNGVTITNQHSSDTMITATIDIPASYDQTSIPITITGAGGTVTAVLNGVQIPPVVNSNTIDPPLTAGATSTIDIQGDHLDTATLALVPDVLDGDVTYAVHTPSELKATVKIQADASGKSVKITVANGSQSTTVANVTVQ